MSNDIYPILANWDFRPNEITVRKVMGDDGKWKIQLRLDLGLLQMDMYGRPDGTRPFGYESLLEYYKSQIREHREGFGSDKEFKLDADVCSELQRETIQYYHRYLSLFQLRDFVHVQNDTKHNLEIIELVKQFASDEKDIWNFEQYRPYVQMMHTRAKASLSLINKNHKKAIKEIHDGILTIQGFFQEYGQSHLAEQSVEIKFLENWLKELQEKQPVSLEEKLRKKLERAVENEEYEQAAVLRDQLNTLLGK